MAIFHSYVNKSPEDHLLPQMAMRNTFQAPPAQPTQPTQPAQAAQPSDAQVQTDQANDQRMGFEVQKWPAISFKILQINPLKLWSRNGLFFDKLPKSGLFLTFKDGPIYRDMDHMD